MASVFGTSLNDFISPFFTSAGVIGLPTSGADTINGGLGADTMNGGDGNDTYIVDNVFDIVGESFNDALGGTSDTVLASVSYSLGLGTTSGSNGFGIENLTLTGAANINATGNAKNNILIGNSGSNVLNGGLGADTMNGGDGNDTYIVDNVFDIVGESFNDALGGTSDTVLASVSYALGLGTTSGSNGFGIENLTLTGTASINATGNAKNNILIGNSGSNVLNGGLGADTMNGGDGNDTYIVDNVFDIVGESFDDFLGGTSDTVLASVSYALGLGTSSGSNGFGIENLTLTGTASINATGNAKSNVLSGNSGNNTFFGSAGNDTINGGVGTDTANYNSLGSTITLSAFGVVSKSALGTDSLIGIESIVGSSLNGDTINLSGASSAPATGTVTNLTTGSVTVNGFAAPLPLSFSISQFENVIGSGFADTITGNSANNVLDGGAGNDTIRGGFGADVLTGGSGSDTFVLDSRGIANADTITDFSAAFDKIGLANSLDDGLPGATSPGIQQLFFNSGNVAGSVLNNAWFFKGFGFTGNSTQLSGIFADTSTGNIFYNPTSSIAGDSQLIAKIGTSAIATLTASNFVYAA
jgi:serralysin